LPDQTASVDNRTVILPSHEQATAAVNSGTCTALERFVYEQEPANFDGIWRVQLIAALEEVVALAKRGE
jgi:hypothetical protein